MERAKQAEAERDELRRLLVEHGHDIGQLDCHVSCKQAASALRAAIGRMK